MELVTAQNDTLYIIDSTGNILISKYIGISGQDGGSRVHMIDDVDNNGILDIGIGYSRNSSGNFKARFYDGNGTMLKEFTKTLNSDGSMLPRAVLNGDIIMNYSGVWSANPRGFTRWNFNTATEIWFYDIGAYPQIISIADVDKNGIYEFTCQSPTTHNGSTGNGYNGNGTTTTDGDIWCIVINENGNEVFSQMYPAPSDGGGVHKFVDFNNDSIFEILAHETHGTTVYQGMSQLHIFNATTGTTLYTYNGFNNGSYWESSICDINNDGIKEIVATNSMDAGGWGFSPAYQYVLNYQLNVLDSSTIAGIIEATGDLNGDGNIEIVLRNYDTLKILDNNLNLIDDYVFGANIWEVIISDLDNNGVNEIIVVTYLDAIYSLEFNIPLLSVTTTQTNVSCNGGSNGTATATASGGVSPYTYNWSNGQTNSTATGLAAGNYFVTVTYNTYTAIDTAIINEPPAIKDSVSTVICSGDSIVLQGNYQTTAGTYYDTLSAINGCDSIIATTLTVNQTSTAPTNVLALPDTVCSGSSTTLTVSGGSLGTGASWKWYSGSCGGVNVGSGSSLPLSPTSGTIYYVRAEGTCNTTMCASVVVTVNNTPTAVTVSGGGTFCNSAILTASGGTGGTIYWQDITSNGTSTATPSTSQTVTSSGAYYFRANNSCGWGVEGSATVTVTGSLTAVVSITSNPGTTIYAGTSVTFTATNTNGIPSPVYQWKLKGINVGINSTTYTNGSLVNGDQITCVLSSGSVCVTGSPATSNTLTITVTDSSVTISSNSVWHIYNAFTPTKDGIDDTWIIEGIELYKVNKVVIFNKWGDVVNTFENYDNLNVVWDGKNGKGVELPAGTYYYVIERGDKDFNGWVQLFR